MFASLTGRIIKTGGSYLAAKHRHRGVRSILSRFEAFHGTKLAQSRAVTIDLSQLFVRSFAPHNLKAVRPAA
jgi:hypothetical protein